MLRQTFGSKGKEVSRGVEGLQMVWGLSNDVGVIKSRRIRWTGHVACMREKGFNRQLFGKF